MTSRISNNLYLDLYVDDDIEDGSIEDFSDESSFVTDVSFDGKTC